MSRSGWTVDTLWEHVRALLAEKDLRDQQRHESNIRANEATQRGIETALAAAEKAVTKAEQATEKRFDAVNEFRGAYQDVIAEQMPRAEAEQRLSAMSEKIDELRKATSLAVGRSGGLQDGWGYLVGAVGLAVALAGWVTR